MSTEMWTCSECGRVGFPSTFFSDGEGIRVWCIDVNDCRARQEERVEVDRAARRLELGLKFVRGPASLTDEELKYLHHAAWMRKEELDFFSSPAEEKEKARKFLSAVCVEMDRRSN